VSDLQDVISALTAEGEEVNHMVAGLDADQWTLPTPAPGWTIAHQIAHLSSMFRLAGLAASDPDGFAALLSRLSADFAANVNAALAEYLADAPEVLFTRWRTECDTAIKAIAAVPPTEPVQWLVRPLQPAVLAAAGMMELFGHGQDIADALRVRRERTDRLWYVVDFGVRTWDFGYQPRKLTPPQEEFRFEITAPSGSVWEFGPSDAQQRISGPAEDFCLLVTRRRHPADLAVIASGAQAQQWLEIAQAYRGPAGEGRKPGQFATLLS
jgi:enediyne biosynthesis protein E11